MNATTQTICPKSRRQSERVALAGCPACGAAVGLIGKQLVGTCPDCGRRLTGFEVRQAWTLTATRSTGNNR